MDTDTKTFLMGHINQIKASAEQLEGIIEFSDNTYNPGTTKVVNIPGNAAEMVRQIRQSADSIMRYLDSVQGKA